MQNVMLNCFVDDIQTVSSTQHEVYLCTPALTQMDILVQIRHVVSTRYKVTNQKCQFSVFGLYSCKAMLTSKFEKI